MISKATWLKNFYGGSLGFLNYEVLTIQHIPRKELAKEPELMTSKWFDYRRLHPMQATYYFVQCYNEAYQAFCRKAINAEAAPFMRCIKGLDFLEAREKLSFWRLRALCDRMGMRYEFFLSFAMNWHYRIVTDEGKIYPPRPAQLLNNEDLIASVMIAWEDKCATSLEIANDHHYRVSNFSGCGMQQAHEAFVIGQIKRRNVPHYALHAALYIYDVVRLEEAIRQFGERVVSASIALQLADCT